ncbi:MAG: SRPBCC domain-containing protein, partial [Candidatus Binataceae bacterium]
RWWGPRGFTMPSCKLDVRAGGVFCFCMRSPEGADHWLQGVYREVVEPERLACTWTWLDADGKPGHETILTVTFDEEGDKTKLTLHQDVFESVTARDAHQSGWTSGLECLAEYLANA